MKLSRIRMAVGTLAALTLVGSSVALQPSAPTPKRPTRGLPTPEKPIDVPPPAPATPAAPAAPGSPTPSAPVQPGKAAPAPDAPSLEPKVGTIITEGKSKDWVLQAEVHLQSDNPTQKVQYTDPFTHKSVAMPKVEPFEFETMGMVWPLIPKSASSVLMDKDVTGRVTVNDADAATEFKVLTGYPAGVRLARFDVAAPPGQKVVCRQVDMYLTIPTRCFATVFDEKAAMAMAWPKTWPPEAASALKPQLYVELGVTEEGKIQPYDDTDVKTALDAFLAQGGVDSPTKMKPAALAKLLASKVWQTVSLNGNGLTYKRTGEISGVYVQPPSWTLRDGRGSERDVTAALAALYRKAGLPVRTVIGFDVSSAGDGRFLQRSNKENKIRSWVEFYLYDDASNTGNWVPVDIVNLKRSSSRPSPLDKPWKYFGGIADLTDVVPFAFQFHPPTDVVAYGNAGFWGWFVTPEPPKSAEQSIRFLANMPAKRGG